ncbi:RNA-directed DNA polymerase, eukaryota [Tanacetum coccineum]
MEKIDNFCIKNCWGNFSFEFECGPSMGNSGGILCVWDPRMFRKHNSTISDYFVAIQGDWIPNAKKYLIISVYAPQEFSEKRMLWSYLNHVIDSWSGETILMGDFNEVRSKEERFGTIFNNHNAIAFNSFISSGGLVEVPLGGCAFTWCHKSGNKMSKLDRFLISEGLMGSCPNITSITLDRYLSDHRPILLREVCYDYGPIPFLHEEVEIFKGADSIRDKKESARMKKSNLKGMLNDIDLLIDDKKVDQELLNKRVHVMNSLHDLEKLEATKIAQKVKINWSIEGDENSKYFHGMLNKKRNQHAIRGILTEGIWIEDPNSVKNEFLSHFNERFDSPCSSRLMLDMVFPNRLSAEQNLDLERNVSKEEIKRAVWDCGTFPKSGNASFIALIPKMQDAKVVKDYRPICLIGSMYKIIAKILANRLVGVLGDLVNEVQSAFIANRQILDGPFILDELIHWCKSKRKKTMIFKFDFEKAYNSVRWDYLDDVLNKFGFGSKWRDWIHNCLHSSKGSILVNGSPTREFHFRKGLKQGQWSESNINTIVQALDCFYKASGLLGGLMSRIKSWDEIVDKLYFRLSKWKMKTLSIGGRLTLLKSVLGSTPIYYMSMYKVPSQVLKCLEDIRRKFFIRADPKENKMSWFKWSRVLASKDKGGSGVSSFFALNRALLFKWMWRFHKDKNALWSRFIRALHGNSVGMGDKNFKSRFPRVYALEFDKKLTVATKINHNDIGFSLRRLPRDGVEMEQFRSLTSILEGVVFPDTNDRWFWSLVGSGEFSVASARKFIDDHWLLGSPHKTCWIKVVPIKINILVWKVRFDFLPTRLNLSHRGIEIQSIICPSSTLMKNGSNGFFSLKMSSKQNDMLEGIFYVTWWLVWNHRNKSLFDSKSPSKAIIFDVLVSRSYKGLKMKQEWFGVRFMDERLARGSEVAQRLARIPEPTMESSGMPRGATQLVDQWEL